MQTFECTGDLLKIRWNLSDALQSLAIKKNTNQDRTLCIARYADRTLCFRIDIIDHGNRYRLLTQLFYGNARHYQELLAILIDALREREVI